MANTLQGLLNSVHGGSSADPSVSEVGILLERLRKWSQDFTYEPLDQARSEIRLVRVRRRDASDRTDSGDVYINADIFVVSLDSELPRYVALSYVWGDVSQTLPILINGHFFKVPYNLYCALSSLEQAAEDIVIWIDLLCINQNDNTEKNWQVQQMNRIYRNAVNVLIWLGRDEGDEFVQNALESIVMLSDLFDQHFRCEEEEGSAAPGVAVDEHAMVAQAVEISEIQWEAICRLLSEYQWFRRIWCLQEVVVSRKAVLWHGRNMLGWSAVEDAMVIMGSVANSSTVEVDDGLRHRLWIALLNTVHLVNIRREFVAGGNEGIPLLNLLRGTRLSDLRATDPRDRVYALLGLSTQIDQNGIAVHYENVSTLATVLFDTAQVLLLQHGARVLERAPLPDPESDLPSWVIDWTCTDGIGLWRSSTDQPFDASRGLQHSQIRIDSTTSADPLLCLDCVIIGEIASRGDEFPTDTNETETPLLDQCRNWLLSIETLISSAMERTTATEKLQKLNEARSNIWRLAVVDSGSNGRAGDDEFQHYQRVTKTKAQLSESVATDMPVSSETEQAMLEQQCRNYNSIAAAHIPFLAEDGSLGLGPSYLQSGDHICILAGGEMPMIIRKVREDRYRLLGAAWIYGIMDGEAITEKTVIQNLSFV